MSEERGHGYILGTTFKKESALCQNCEKHRATVKWTGKEGDLAIIHGVYQMWCHCCVLKVQIRNAKEKAAQIIELEDKLSKIEPVCERQLVESVNKKPADHNAYSCLLGTCPNDYGEKCLCQCH